METTLRQRDIDAIAYKTAIVYEKRMQKHQQPDFITTAEAAQLLRITPGRLRQIVCEDPQRYPHIKRGSSKQSKLLFDRNALLQA